VNNLYDSIYSDPERTSRTYLKMLHISDVHIDSLYKVGSNADCDGYLCCREENGEPSDPSKAAGHWGGYLCDLPEDTWRNFLDHIVKTHTDIDGVFWTGDNGAHNTWNNTNEEVLYYTKYVTNSLKTAFEGTGIPIYPCTGNHDTWPINIQDFSGPGRNFIVNNIYEDWAEWLGEEGTTQFKKWGYAAAPFKLANGEVLKGSKVILLQTQATNTQNFYLPGFKNDPSG